MYGFDPEFDSYIGNIPLNKLLSKNKTYKRIQPVVGMCIDGMVSFILISPDKALYIIGAPDPNIYLLHKTTK